MRFAFHRLFLRPALWIAGLMLLSGLPLVQAASADLGRPLLRVHTPGEYMGPYMCPAIAQDSEGVIYVATGTYLRAFDGATWHYVRSLPVESAGIREFAVTTSGTVFAGGPDIVGFIRHSGAAAEFVSLADRLPPGSRDIAQIRHVAAIGDAVYFSDEEKILIWRDEHFTAVPCPSRPNSHGARLHRVGDTLYVTALDHALHRLAADRLERVADNVVVRENRIITVEAGPDAGTLLLLTAERGFFQLDASGRIAPFESAASRWLAGKRIYCALRLADGSLAVGFSAVSGDGGMRFDPAGTYLGPLDMSIGLVVKTIRTFFQDREGGLWIGTEMGPSRMEWPSGATMFDASNGLGYGTVTDVLRDEGVLYAATNEGLFRLRPADDRGQTARFELVLNRPVFALAAHANGLLALGDAELFAQSPSGFRAVARMSPGSRALLVSRLNSHRAWVGTAGGVHAVRHDGDGWRDEGVVSGLAAPAESLGESADGALWAAGPGSAIVRVLDGRVERFEKSAGFRAGFTAATVVARRGELLAVVDNDARPYRFDTRQKRFSVWAGTESLTVDLRGGRSSVSREEGALWFGGFPEIHGLEAGGAPRRLPSYVSAAVGAVTRLYQESAAAGDVLWVGGERGLVRVEVARMFVPTTPFQTQLRAANVHAGARLEPEHAPLTFTFAAPRFRVATNLVYQTRLVGREREWSEWQPLRERSFPHLPSGRYRFEVRARDTDGVISAPAELAFVVLAPWWFSWWAWTGYLGVGAGVLIGVVRLRTRALRQRAERLESIVAERTQELAQQNTELTRLHRLELDEKISAKLGEEKARLEVLRYQLNPHFLFNALATISGLAVRDPKAARRVARELAEFCRLTLTRGRHEFVTLEEEFQMLESYLNVVRAGAERPPVVTFSLDPGASGVKIPAFLLLPLVENASKYGRGTGAEPLQIAISAQAGATNGTLAVEVANTGTWVDDFTDRGETPSTRIGLENIRQRLARIYPGAHEFTTEGKDGWVRARLSLSVSVPAS